MNATTFQTSSQKQNDYKEMKNAHKLLKRREKIGTKSNKIIHSL